MKILIKAIGFIGDNLFGSSVAKKLKDSYPNSTIDYLLTLPQPLELLGNNPYIDNVLLSTDESQYDVIHQLKPLHRKETPCIQFQKQCKVPNPSSEFDIITNSNLDKYVNHMLSPYQGVKIAWMSNWEEKSFLYSEEEYKRGIDVPNLGYGGKRRDIKFIINSLSQLPNVYLFEVGKPVGYSQKEVDLMTVSEYTLTASLIKSCDYFIGGEGGLCNLAAGVGTSTIITGDYVHQLYGWNGVIERNQTPKLGPIHYFNSGHYELNPYLTDEEVVANIKNIINNEV